MLIGRFQSFITPKVMKDKTAHWTMEKRNNLKNISPYGKSLIIPLVEFPNKGPSRNDKLFCSVLIKFITSFLFRLCNR
jgi:hypothetical protein